jgi:primosomal protein N' (replication factor Y)
MSEKIADITLDEVQKIVQDQTAWKVVNSLIEKGIVSVYENLNENYKPKKENYVFLQPKYKSEAHLKPLIEALEKAPKQLNILLTFLHLEQTEIGVQQSQLLKIADASAAQLKTLCDKDIFEVKKLEVDRLRYEYSGELIKNELNAEQKNAYQKIKESFAQEKPVLLKGVTGSGKTHIYFELIKDCLAQGKQALYLLPEIALTAQIIRKLRSVFGNEVGVYHSRFSNNERVEIWHKTHKHKLNILIGARSALLLPFANLGLIIVDEEHDSSYKQQEPAPRYHARDAALFLASQSRANIILGSATPSLESYYNATQHKYTLVELHRRYSDLELPQIQIIDTKLQLKEKKQQGIFSTLLIDQIKESLLRKKQVILFQNRRGYSPFSLCTDCGWVPQCKYCDVSLTYHKHSDQMHCHYCGTKTPYIRICPACGGNRITAKSFGTEKVEDDIKKIFPYARVQRFDWDAMRIKNKYNEIIRQFEKGEIDILVGTQMVVKGLDFEHVNLVGVLSADSLLSAPDFRVNERVYQLLEQVGGRAGRKHETGKVLIQAFKTNHPILLHVQQYQYDAFYKSELEMRNEFLYPPFTRLIKITLKHKKAELAAEAALRLGKHLSTYTKLAVFGPAEPPIARIRNYYHQEILLKVNRDTEFLKEVKRDLKHQIALLTSSKNMSQLQVVLDVDPY